MCRLDALRLGRALLPKIRSLARPSLRSMELALPVLHRLEPELRAADELKERRRRLSMKSGPLPILHRTAPTRAIQQPTKAPNKTIDKPLYRHSAARPLNTRGLSLPGKRVPRVNRLRVG